jgi:hypothetical protein
MGEICEYTLVEGWKIDDLKRDVNKLIRDGWQPLGGISLHIKENYEHRYCQAMTLRNKGDEK